MGTFFIANDHLHAEHTKHHAHLASGISSRVLFNKNKIKLILLLLLLVWIKNIWQTREKTRLNLSDTFDLLPVVRAGVWMYK